MRDLYTLTQAARALTVSRQAVYDAIRRGRLLAERRAVVPGAPALLLIPAASLYAYRRDRGPAPGRQKKKVFTISPSEL